jgi:hypothetical protein
MRNSLNILKSSNFVRYFRNILNIKPSIVFKPQNPNSSISDFFYWESSDYLETCFIVSNLYSHSDPLNASDDKVTLLIYNSFGEIIENKQFVLNPNENKIIQFDHLKKNKYGSFLVFHDFNKEVLVKNKTFISDRGYVGYRRNKGLWNYVHGNNYAFCFSPDKKIKSIMATSILHNSYTPQVTFNDCKKFMIIFSNPLQTKLTVNLTTFDKNRKILSSKKYKMLPFETKKISYLDCKISIIRLKSKLLFNRPLILKEYKTYFDIFHS